MAIAINGAGVRVCIFPVPSHDGMSFESAARAAFYLLYPQIPTWNWRFVEA